MASLSKCICRVQDVLYDNKIFAEVYPYDSKLGIVAVEINRGDWKHDHQFADELVKRIGGRSMGNAITEEDGSDCFSAVHFYAF